MNRKSLLFQDFDDRMKHVNALVSSGNSNSSSKRRHSQKNYSYQSSNDSGKVGSMEIVALFTKTRCNS
jgi:hypothetical protein